MHVESRTYDCLHFVLSSADHPDPPGHPPHAAGARWGRHGATGLCPPPAEG